MENKQEIKKEKIALCLEIEQKIIDAAINSEQPEGRLHISEIRNIFKYVIERINK